MKQINSVQPKVIFLMGPTASNKTQIAIMLSQHFPIDIISVDSALVYKGMDIGTSKPTINQLIIAPHRLLDIIDPSETYSVFDFRKDALIEIKNIINNGRTPLLVGGTMLYFKILLEGLSPLPPPNIYIRKKIIEISNTKGWIFLHKLLCDIDFTASERIHFNDHHRILRALEIFFISGKTMTELQIIPGQFLPYKVYKFIVAPANKEILYKRIVLRFQKMIDKGLENEVKILFERGDLHENMPSMRCVGYRQMWAYLSGKINYSEMISHAIFATKQLAKHQFTWLRKNQFCSWLNSDCSSVILETITKVFDQH